MIEKKNALEWTVFAGSLALITLTVGTLAIDGITQRDARPDLSVELGVRTPQGDSLLLHLSVRNRGAGSAEKVRVHVESDDPAVSGDLELDFVPRASSREGFVVLLRAAPGLRARVIGWVQP